MNITRCISDFGNSMSQHLIDGNYFEMPSSITEISEKKASSLFTDSVDMEQLKEQLVIKINLDGKDRYFKVGRKAETDIFGNEHIFKLHDKTESLTVIVTWLAALAFYHVNQSISDPEQSIESELNQDVYLIDIEYFLTMLPIWLIKKSDNFGDMLKKMEQRFEKNHEVELITPNYQRVLNITVKKAVCRVEGETSRYALKFDLQLAPKNISKFDMSHSVICDWGAQTLDLTKLQPRLRKPADTDDFASFTDKSYLKSLEDLRTTKLMDYFGDVRTLERFILENIKFGIFEYEDPTTKKKTDFTSIIENALQELASIIVIKALNTFHFSHGQTVYYIWTGGVSEILKKYIEQVLVQALNKDIASNYHIFPDESRKLNIFGGEIYAKSQLAKMGLIEKTTVPTTEVGEVNDNQE
ncbi:hypothetical protein BHU72_14615 [Desulfuribacillus stibiiarsenatis]|uniref:Alp7A-like C-terminal domain-containing protein n=1 Tax=Desulfuribacillus stibiiarsenatis TaxID=1390249 RepID=A0A1E5L7U6_9FIRM|nr:hypothetical protein [Desulfuribacillus stibiiarsenatis]OEH86059.1 hypothetical protein BHU72_14615 [Desulfuribacillus stibiiarsenatis]